MNEITQIQFLIEVIPGKIPEHAINAAIRLNATSVILDRSLLQFFQTFLFYMMISHIFKDPQSYKQDQSKCQAVNMFAFLS